MRLVKNNFFKKVDEAEKRGASREELAEILGRGKAKKGMFEGDMDNGELEIGQIAAMVDEIKSAAVIVEEILAGV